MSFTRFILLLASALLLGYFFWKEYAYDISGVTAFQLADTDEALKIMSGWTASQIDELKWVTRVDYVFLVCYSCLLAGLSTERMNLEPGPGYNNLLRFSIPLSLVAGLSDLLENIVLIHNLNAPDRHVYGGPLTMIKFGLVAWILLVLLVAFVRSRVPAR